MKNSFAKMRVVLVAHYAPSLLLFRAPFIRALVQRGAEVLALAPDYTPELKARVEALGASPLDYPLNRTGLSPWEDLKSFLALWRHLKALKPDAVLAYAAKPVVYGILAAWLAGVPRRVALIEGLGYAFTEGERSWKRRLVQGVLQALYRISLARAHRVVFLNPDDREEFIARGLVRRERAFLLGGIGVPLEDFPPAPPHLEPFTFTLVARLLWEKGVLEFVEAARRVKARHPGVRFLLIGPLDTNPGAIPEREVQAWVEEGIVEWIPWAEDIRPYLRETSVFVLPSYREGVPRSTQEALALARPVITADAPGCRETVVHGVNGFLVPPRDPQALAQAMERFLEDPGLIPKMGEASRRLAEERFNAGEAACKLLRVLGIE